MSKPNDRHGLLHAAANVHTYLKCGSSRSFTGGPGGAGILVSL